MMYCRKEALPDEENRHTPRGCEDALEKRFPNYPGLASFVYLLLRFAIRGFGEPSIKKEYPRRNENRGGYLIRLVNPIHFHFFSHVPGGGIKRRVPAYQRLEGVRTYIDLVLYDPRFFATGSGMIATSSSIDHTCPEMSASIAGVTRSVLCTRQKL